LARGEKYCTNSERPKQGKSASDESPHAQKRRAHVKGEKKQKKDMAVLHCSLAEKNFGFLKKNGKIVRKGGELLRPACLRRRERKWENSGTVQAWVNLEKASVRKE